MTRRAIVAAMLSGRLAVLFWGAGTASAAIGESLPLALIQSARTFVTLDEAATAALAEALSRGEVYEWGGALFECGDKFFATEPVSAKRSAHVRFRIAKAAGCRLAGIYHTHPHGDAADRFSSGDVAVVQKLRVDSYIGVAQDRSVRVLRANVKVAGTRWNERVTGARFETQAGTRLPQEADRVADRESVQRPLEAKEWGRVGIAYRE